MLKVRNQLAHDYDGVTVKEHCGTIVHVYIDKLYDFKKAVEKLLKETIHRPGHARSVVFREFGLWLRCIL